MARPNVQDDPFPKERDWTKARDWFERRLEGRPLPEERLLGARGALRSLPFLHKLLDFPGKKGRLPAPSLLLSCLRCYAISAGSALVPPPEIKRFCSAADNAATAARSAANAYVSDAAYAAAYAADNAATAARSAAGAYAYVSDAAASAADDAASAYLSAAAAAAAAAFEQDCRALDAQGIARLAAAPLWPRLDAEVQAGFAHFDLKAPTGSMPRSVRGALNKFNSRLRALPGDFAIWTEWYQGILAGESNGTYLFGLPTERALRLNIEFALIDEELWTGDPAALHAEMRRLVEVATPRAEIVAAHKGSENGVFRFLNARKNQRNPIADCPPIPGLKSALQFEWNPNGLLKAVPGELARLGLPNRVTPEMHAKHLEAFHFFVNSLIEKIDKQQHKLKEEYRAYLDNARQWIPTADCVGNIMIADGEMRSLRNLFWAERALLSQGFAADLKTVLEAYQAVRSGFPEVSKYYDLVRSGNIGDPLLDDAMEGVFAEIGKARGLLFEASTFETMTAGTSPQAGEPAAMVQPDSSLDRLSPPPDPIGEADAKKVDDVEKAGNLNALVDKLDKANKGLEAAQGIQDKSGKFLEAVKPYWEPIQNWIRTWGSSGGGPPDLPPINVV